MERVSRTRVQAVFLLMLAGLLACPTMAWPQREDSTPRRPASANPCLKFLPKDYWLVGNLDFKSIMDFYSREGRRQKENPQLAMYKQYMQMIRLMTGIDPEKDVNYVTFFVAGNPDRDPKGLVVLEGSFDKDSVEGRLEALGQGTSSETHKGKTIRGNSTMGYCFPEASTLLLGSPSLLREAVDATDGPARKMPEPLKELLDQTDGASLVWLALRPEVPLGLPDLADWRKENEKLVEALRPIRCASFYFELDDQGLLTHGLGYLGRPDQAKRLYDYLVARKKALLHEEGSNVFYSSFLVLSKVETAGPFVKGTLQITGGALERLWQTKFIIKPSQEPPP